jgi:hypothetical protein
LGLVRLWYSSIFYSTITLSSNYGATAWSGDEVTEEKLTMERQ